MSELGPFDPDYTATVSAELVMVIAQAGAIAEEGETGEPLLELVTHARDLHDILSEQLISAEPAEMKYARGLAESLGNRLEDLAALVRRDASGRPLL